MASAAENDLTDPKPWLVRIPGVFAELAAGVLPRFGALSSMRLGQDYDLIKTATPEAIQQSDVSIFAQWNLPLEHTWPCAPRKMEGFIEKAAQTLWRKFGSRHPQGIFIGTLQPASQDKYYKTLASNLRGRVLQLFPKSAVNTVEEQEATAQTLFCLVGKEGLFAGMQSPRASNGFYPGGSKFIALDAPNAISRAGAKIAEALHYLLLYRPALAPGCHWLELGACPGGMTSELLARGHRVTAIDRAPLDHRLHGRMGLTFVLEDVAAFHPSAEASYDAILSDLNGSPMESMAQVIRLSGWLRTGGVVVFTLKLAGVESIDDTCALFGRVVAMAEAAGLRKIAATHLTYNRHEFTLFLER